ncbi:MAG: hypothetical protein AAFY50_15225 [Cyanobacteria bacterium J06648_1]
MKIVAGGTIKLLNYGRAIASWLLSHLNLWQIERDQFKQEKNLSLSIFSQSATRKA